jgi:hypothetical protein
MRHQSQRKRNNIKKCNRWKEIIVEIYQKILVINKFNLFYNSEGVNLAEGNLHCIFDLSASLLSTKMKRKECKQSTEENEQQ